MIKVEVTTADVNKWLDEKPASASADEWVEIKCMAYLRNSGIPVKGFLLFRGVSEGRLEWYDDFATDNRIFKWTPPSEQS